MNNNSPKPLVIALEEHYWDRELAATYEGIEREGSRGSRGFYDLAVYSLLDREWRQSPISTDR